MGKRRDKQARNKHRSKGGPPMADQADRHVLYEQSVQSVDTEVEFLRDTYREIRKRPAVSLREDFCGTAAAACEWVRTDHNHTAVGVDIDASVLDWGREHNVGRLDSDAQLRIKLVEDDVFKVDLPPVDIAVAFNFSYWIFDTRETLRGYFETVRRGLNDEGLFICDAFGGAEAFDEVEEETEHDGFTYIWEQSTFDPISHDMQCYIHFTFPDGSAMKRAFSYRWRFWTLPEIRELLLEAGFSDVTFYWDRSEEDDESDYVPVERGDADPAWIAYIVATP
ncbi:MAG: class I SAM-dependent methyltransferase [Pseudomonadota bacterium]